MSTNIETTIEIRDLKLTPEIRAVEELQKEVWGIEDRDLVPASHLIAVKEAGGILTGAFDGATLVGFVYGFFGLEEGRTTLHSHLLAVKPAYRSHDLGYRLKLAQRERALAKGIALITWTFDPLQSLNAHLNLGKLGVVSDRYMVNFYGEDSTSFLHRTGTDRLWVSWVINSEWVKRRVAPGAESKVPRHEADQFMVEADEQGAPIRNDLVLIERPPTVAIHIPGGLVTLQREDPELAVSWREATRWAFTEAIAVGYLVEDFYRQEKNGRSYGAYLLRAGKKIADVI